AALPAVAGCGVLAHHRRVRTAGGGIAAVGRATVLIVAAGRRDGCAGSSRTGRDTAFVQRIAVDGVGTWDAGTGSARRADRTGGGDRRTVAFATVALVDVGIVALLARIHHTVTTPV